MMSPLESDHADEMLKRVLETGSDAELAEVAEALFAAADDDPGFANIAADWLQYGRYGVSKDEARAALFRSKAIDALIPDAIYDHALIIEGQDEGGTKNALPYYILSAVLGDANAISALSEYFLYGEEFNTNYFISGALKKHENLLREQERVARSR